MKPTTFKKNNHYKHTVKALIENDKKGKIDEVIDLDMMHV